MRTIVTLLEILQLLEIVRQLEGYLLALRISNLQFLPLIYPSSKSMQARLHLDTTIFSL